MAMDKKCFSASSVPVSDPAGGTLQVPLNISISTFWPELVDQR